jgi:hypothetical protein
MNWYRLAVVLHLLAVVLWFGHMFFWSVVVGPVTKRLHPPEAGLQLRQLSLRYGGLGWPALGVLIITGMVMLSYRGVTLSQLLSGEMFVGPFGRGLAIKFLLVAWMLAYQAFVGHRPAPRLIYVNILAALGVLAVSVLLVRAPNVF